MYSSLRSLVSLKQSLVIAFVLLASYPIGAASTTYRDLIGTIGKARSQTCSRAAIAKQKFTPTSDEFIQAERLYQDAFSSYGLWNNDILSALRDGKPLNRTDVKYKNDSEDASATAIVFLNYVDEKTKPQSKSPITVASTLFDLGFNIYSKISDLREKKKQAAISEFKEGTAWKSWGDIPVNGTCPQ